MTDIDTTNECFVGAGAGGIVILNPKRHFTKDRALVFAAWVVALCDPSPDHAAFRAALDAVENT